MIETVLDIKTISEFGRLSCKVYEIVAGAKYLAVSVWDSKECPSIHEDELTSVEDVKEFVKWLTNGAKAFKIDGKGEFERLTAVKC